MISKKPSKAERSKAAKVLGNPNSSKAAKKSAARTLSSANTHTRTVKSPPKKGTFTSAIRIKAMKKAHAAKARKK